MKLVARLSPTTILYIATVFVVMWVSLILLIATKQPYLGVVLSNNNQAVTIESIASPQLPQRLKNTSLLSISSPTKEIKLQSIDLTIEPDSAMQSYQDYAHFLNRQDQIHQLLKHNDQVSLLFSNQERHDIPIASARPILSLDASFWIQIFVGVTSWLITAAIFAFRTNTLVARYLLLSGFSTLLFATFAAVYTTRELALDADLFQFLNDYNFFGGSLYIASFIALLLYYPRKIAPAWLGVFVLAIYVIWFIAQQVGVFADMRFARRILVMIGLVCSIVLTIIHWKFSERNPVERAALQWFLLSWILGISLFAVFILLPTLFGIDTSALQGYAFLLILMVYIGLALGILRYRLFELDVWWGRTILLLAAIIALLLIDIGLINILHMAPNIALASPNQSHLSQWKMLFQDQFQPLHIAVESHQHPVKVAQDGLSLHIPSVHQLPALTIQYAAQGRRLFSSHDVNTANEICNMLDYAFEARQAYEAGILEERKRISRDLHDNVGSQLVNALHQPENNDKNEMIRSTLMDLRQIINNNFQGIHALDELFATLRHEASQQLDSADIRLDWQMTGECNIRVPVALMHSIRSIIREGVHNIVRHTHAKHAKIQINIHTQNILITIQDDGQGLPQIDQHEGHGLKNMRTRTETLGGEIHYCNLSQGFLIKIELPICEVNDQ